MRNHRSLGRPRCARRINKDCQIGWLRERNCLFPKIWIFCVIGLTNSIKLINADDHLIIQIPKPIHIVDDDLSQIRQAVANSQNFIQLFFIFCDEIPGSGVFAQILNLLGTVCRIHTIADTTDTQDPHIRIKPFRVVIAEDRYGFAALKP